MGSACSEIQGVSPLANRDHFSLVNDFLFIGCRVIDLEPKTELHLAAGDLLRVINAATRYKRVASQLHHRLFCIQLFPPGHPSSFLLLA